MLTKDLLRYKFRKNQIYPQFIDPASEGLLSLAESLIDLFENAVSMSRQALQEQTELLIQASECLPLIGRGLEKLLLDRTEFDTTDRDDLMSFRHEVFQQISPILRQPHSSLESYQKEILQMLGRPHEELSMQLYSDLPAYQCVTLFKSVSAGNLLHRYNSAQVQGLLLRSQQLEVTLFDPEVASLRQLLKYLRFHQLLCRMEKKGAKDFHLTIEGPLNLFMQTQKYGMNLALFFPAILHQKRWSLEGQIQWKPGVTSLLKLDHDCGIKSHYHHFLAYVPEELGLIEKNFTAKSITWNISPANHWIPLPGEIYCIPDYVFQHPHQPNVFLELFHSWHSQTLCERLSQLGSTLLPHRLLLGVSKSLAKNAETKSLLENSDYFKKNGFLFSTLPTADQLLTKLGQSPDEE